MTDTMNITDDELTEILESADTDPEAPYGRFKNGKPRKAPAGKYSDRDVPAPGKGVPSSGSSKSSKGKSTKNSGPDYKTLANNVLQLPILATATAGQIISASGRHETGQAIAADAMTIGLYADPLTDKIAQLAENDARIGSFLERFGKGGVYGEVISLGLAIAWQIGTNHGRMPTVPAMGIVSRDEIIAAAQQKAGVSGEPAGA